MNQSAEQRTSEWVSATAKENAWAGAGAGVVVQVVQGFMYTLFGYTSEHSVLLSGLSGFGVFGLLSLIRFTMDEWRLVWDARDRAIATQMIVELQAIVAEQGAELKRLRRQLRGHEFNEASRDAREVVVADEDDMLRVSVHEIIARWQQDVSYARDQCAITKTQWAAAMRFLYDAGVVEKGGPVVVSGCLLMS